MSTPSAAIFGDFTYENITTLQIISSIATSSYSGVESPFEIIVLSKLSCKCDFFFSNVEETSIFLNVQNCDVWKVYLLGVSMLGLRRVSEFLIHPRVWLRSQGRPGRGVVSLVCVVGIGFPESARFQSGGAWWRLARGSGRGGRGDGASRDATWRVISTARGAGRRAALQPGNGFINSWMRHISLGAGNEQITSSQ